MKLKNQVPSLELCKKLKELGYQQEGMLFYGETMEGIELCYKGREYNTYGILNKNGCEVVQRCIICVAPTVAEMLEIIPYRIRMPEDDYWLCMSKLKHGGLDLRYITSERKALNGTYGIIQDDKHANAVTGMLIYLYENKLI